MMKSNASHERQRTMARHFIAEQEIFSFFRRPSCVIANAIFDNDRERVDIIDLPAQERKELYDFVSEYNERFFVLGDERASTVVIPTLYPSSSLCVSLRFPLSVSILQKLIKESGEEECFALSRYAEIKTVRMSRKIKALLPEFSLLCQELRECFLMPRRDRYEPSKADIEALCYRLSYFTGCPIELCMSEDEDYTQTDIGLFAAFLLTVFMSARNKAPDRSVKIGICSRSNAAHIMASFECVDSIFILSEITEWQRISADKNMIFDRVQDEKGNATLVFHPYRYDWSLLGIKQDIVFLD